MLNKKGADIMEQQKKEMLEQKLGEALQKNDAFCQAFAAAENAESIQGLLRDNGIDVSIGDVEGLFADGVKEILRRNEEGELTEEDMDTVAGGGWIRGTIRLVASCGAGFGYGCICGVFPAASAAAPYVAGGLAAWTTAGYLR